MTDEKHQILLIEDDLDMQQAIRVMLPEKEFALTACSTGPAGLEALRHSPPDLVLVDIMLATPSEGFHLCYQIKDNPKWRHIPVIMVSAIGVKTGVDYARELGSEYVPADAFLEKPIDARTLLQAIRKLLPVRT